MTTKILKSTCPICNYEMDCATSISGERKPSKGDLTVCLNCGEILRQEITRAVHKALSEHLAEPNTKGSRYSIAAHIEWALCDYLPDLLIQVNKAGLRGISVKVCTSGIEVNAKLDPD